MNQIVSFPSEIVKCKKCGSRYIYEPGSCAYPFPRLVPLSIKGWIATLKNFFKRDKKEKDEKEKKEEKNGITIGIISFHLTCPICGGEIEKNPWYFSSESN